MPLPRRWRLQNGADMGTLDATLTALEVQTRTRPLCSISRRDFRCVIDEPLGAMDTYNQAEEAYRSASPSPPASSITIQTQRSKSLEMMHGRYRYRIRSVTTPTRSGDRPSWPAYSDVGAQRTKALDKKRTTPPAESPTGPNQPRTTRPACPRTGHARRTRRTAAAVTVRS